MLRKYAHATTFEGYNADLYGRIGTQIIMWKIRETLLTLVLALMDKRTPPIGKLLALFSVAYLISPVDILPDVMPLAGLLDDLVVVPLGLWASRLKIPESVLDEARETARAYTGVLNTLIYIFVSLVVAWLIMAIVLAYLLIRGMVA